MTDTTAKPQRSPLDWRHFLSSSGLLLAVIVLFVVLALIAPNFLTSRNLLNVLRAVSFNGIIACSITLMIIQGDIDVSIGSAVAWSSSLLGVLVIKMGWPLGLAVPVVLAQGMLIHALAGYIRVRWLVPSFVLTLALFMMLRGAARQITNAFPISPFPAGFEFWGGGTIDILGLGLPVPVLIMLIVFVIFYIVSTRTVFGRSVYCVGGNEHAARLSGINVGKTRIISFMLVGLLSAFVGILLSSRIQSGSSQIALGLEFEVIAAVIIGGTSLMGGAGSIFGTFLGVLFIGLIGNGMVLSGVSPFMQEIVRGFIILVAVFVSILQAGTAKKGN
ncbi:MAG: ABC transporter permease [Maritimibacter sp.]|nr:ABC transporter permease [Maritimibacter sp.]